MNPGVHFIQEESVFYYGPAEFHFLSNWSDVMGVRGYWLSANAIFFPKLHIEYFVILCRLFSVLSGAEYSIIVCFISFNNPLAMSHLARTHRPLRGQKHLIMPPQQPSTGHPQIWAFGGNIHSVMGGVPATTAPSLYPSTTSQQQDYSGVPYPFEVSHCTRLLRTTLGR